MNLFNVISDLNELDIKRINKNQERLEIEDELFDIDQDIYLVKSNIFKHFCKKEVEYFINPKEEKIAKMGNVTSFIYEDGFSEGGDYLYNCLIKRNNENRFQIEIVHPRHMFELFMKTNRYAELYRDALIAKIIDDDK